MPKDPEILAHQEWLGYVQPVGLVVSIPALVSAGAYINRNFAPDHRRFLEALPADKDGHPVPEVRDFAAFAASFFGWASSDLYGSPGAPGVPPSLEVALPEYSETIRPTYALRDFQPSDSTREFLMLIHEFAPQTDFDAPAVAEARQWQASPQAKFERLLRQTGIQIGLLVNGRQIRLVYAPEKELSGHITFNIGDMISVAGRPICSAMLMLLCSDRLYIGSPEQRLPAILANSRKYQNVVSTQLAEQVLEALYELLRGFQAAHDQANRELLGDVLARHPDHVYHGLLTVLLRLVFLLFAEDRGLLSTDPIYANNYSITGLYDRLREDNGRYADLMDHRFGAWAQLLALFRLIYSGGSHGAMRIPAREGYLFDPDRYLFLEGRKGRDDMPVIPRVSDGVVFRVLSKLFLLDGERLSYRTLAVEQIGSVYQAIMGFSLQVATGRSIAIKPKKKRGAPATLDLENLLRTPTDHRLRQFKDETDQKLTGHTAEALKSAQTVDELLAALERKIATAVTPMPVPKGAMVFQPSDERRRSGSHYTPSSLTGPIVEAALEPVLEQLGGSPTPAQILNLKVCDLAMGSAAFLVEACRQLGDALAKAWHAHGVVPVIPPDEDEVLHAQRQIAQRCLYGLDKNPMAADLAKLSLWLATLAKDHPFTFLDHSLRHGDALVGLTRRQIASFNWAPAVQQSFLEQEIRRRISRATEYRQRILDARDSVSYAHLEQALGNADEALDLPRMVGDAAISAFFSAEKTKQREERRRTLEKVIEDDLKTHGFLSVDGEVERAIQALRKGPKGITPFHWEMEFPEVFTNDKDGNVTGGFDAIVGNPPFAGRNSLIGSNREYYLNWLQTIFPDSQANADLVSYFFRLAFNFLKPEGCFGLIATNTISQGESRYTGLRWICLNDGTIYRAVKRLKWPGEAAVIVSVVHVYRGVQTKPFILNGREVDRITAYLVDAGGDENPANLQDDRLVASEGTKIYSPGFTFDDTRTDGQANSCAEMSEILQRDSRAADRIFPYLGGDEVATHPSHQHHRYVINFEEMPLDRVDLTRTWLAADEGQRKAWLRTGRVPLDYPGAVAEDWPELLRIVERKVKPYRLSQDDEQAKRFWWRFQRVRRDLYNALRPLSEVLAINCGATPHLAFAFVSARQIFAHSLVLVSSDSRGLFATLQSRVHEVWARREASSMKDDLRYTHSVCLHSFPLPRPSWDMPPLTDAGSRYIDFRASLMIRNDEGLTTTYNRFHNPDEGSGEVRHLRELHDQLDRAVLDVYGWTDIRPKCEFIPEFDEDEEEESGSQAKTKYRYRWPDEVRDKVLARLLDLNRQRAPEENALLTADPNPATPPKERGKPRKRKATSVPEPIGSLFAGEDGDD